jgi:hypothetical protein
VKFYCVVRIHSNRIIEELLIDFRELIGEHSGENLAEAVYDTIQLYDLKDKVSACIVPAPRLHLRCWPVPY